jgi:formate hydrogenlyase subunit 4
MGHFNAGAVAQLAGLALAPVLPGCIQLLKARLQGRRGPGPLQPYRDLRRLWSKSAVAPHDTTLIYRLAPSLAAATLACAVLVIPIAGESIDVFGTDMLVVVGLLALARLVVTVAAFDPGTGFALMGAGRDLMFGVFAEPLLLLSLTLLAVSVGSTDLLAITDGAGASNVVSSPAHWCAALAIALLVLVETGRQPIDNPDTHLELTMVHEGPLLEYAGRDLAMLQWTAAARHWVVLLLAVGMFVPMPNSAPAAFAVTVLALAAMCALLALVESSVAKLRILRVPALLGTGTLVCIVGLIYQAVSA